MNRVRRIFRPQYVIPTVIVLIILGRVALHSGAGLTIKGAVYDALGMGGAYATRWHTTVLLGAIGVGLALGLSLPVLLLRGRPTPIVLDPDAAPLGDPRDPRGDALMHRFPGLGRRADESRRQGRGEDHERGKQRHEDRQPHHPAGGIPLFQQALAQAQRLAAQGGATGP